MVMQAACQAYDKAIELDLQYAYAWNNKGAAFKALDRTAEATPSQGVGYTG